MGQVVKEKGRVIMECKYQLKDGCMRISMPKEVDHHCAEQLRKEYSGGVVFAEHLNERIQKIFVVSGLHKMIQVSSASADRLN